jgi:hypothetical protein
MVTARNESGRLRLVPEVTLGDMQNSEKFRLVAAGEPPG